MFFCNIRYTIVYRGDEYRLRRKRWWGWQWYHQTESETYSTYSYEAAKNMCRSVNEEIERKEKFIQDKKWREVPSQSPKSQIDKY